MLLDWTKLLDARRIGPPWCVEYVRFWRRVPRATFGTLLRATAPWGFWTQLTMFHKVRIGRILLLVAAVTAPLVYVTLAMSIGLEVWRASSQMMITVIPPSWAGMRAAALPFSSFRNNAARIGWYDPKPRELLMRYSPNPFPVAVRSFRRGLDRHGLQDHRDAVRGQMVFAAMTLAMCPAGFALLPFTRRVAKVRWVHLMRIAAYSLILLAFVIALDAHMHIMLQRPFAGIGMYTFLLTMILAVIWWAAACDRYLKLSHPWAVAATVVALGLFGARALVAAVDFLLEMI